MFNVTVLKMKDIMKFFIGLIFLLIIIYISKYFYGENNKEKIADGVKNGIKIIARTNMLGCIDTTVPTISTINKENIKEGTEENKSQSQDNILEQILKTEISSISGLEEIEKRAEKENAEQLASEDKSAQNQEQQNEEQIQMAQTGLPTQVITNNPIQESYNVEYGKVKIKNQTGYELTQEMLTPDITVENKNVILFHTHSCESYTSSEKYPYTPTGNFRTTDLNYTVTRVGTELENQLKQYNYNVIHSTDYHDYPAYNGSYTRSLATVENILKTTPSDIIIDVHRDAVGARSDYAPTVKIGEVDEAAQIMFVIGTNAGGLWHPNWNQNLKFAIKVQEKAEEMYPGLFKPIMLTESRYNQHTGKYASIIEVGATGHTLEQCLTSMKYLARVMNEVM